MIMSLKKKLTKQLDSAAAQQAVTRPVDPEHLPRNAERQEPTEEEIAKAEEAAGVSGPQAA